MVRALRNALDGSRSTSGGAQLRYSCRALCLVLLRDATSEPQVPLPIAFAGRAALVHRRFELGLGQSIKACMRRDATLMWRNKVRSRLLSRVFPAGVALLALAREFAATPSSASASVPGLQLRRRHSTSHPYTTPVIKADCRSPSQVVYLYRVAQLLFVVFASSTLFLRTTLSQNTIQDGRPYLSAPLDSQPLSLIFDTVAGPNILARRLLFQGCTHCCKHVMR